MSFDLGVWYPEKRIANKEAGELYARLRDGDTSGAVPNPAIDLFYAELTARHPEIDTIPKEKLDEHDYSPWSCKLDHSPGHVIMSCVWPKATEMRQLVQGLARKYGLAIYDPQSRIVTYPDGSTGSKGNRGTLLVLGSLLLIFAVIFLYMGTVAPPGRGSPLAFYAMAVFCTLVAVACFGKALTQRRSLEAGSGVSMSR